MRSYAGFFVSYLQIIESNIHYLYIFSKRNSQISKFSRFQIFFLSLLPLPFQAASPILLVNLCSLFVVPLLFLLLIISTFTFIPFLFSFISSFGVHNCRKKEKSPFASRISPLLSVDLSSCLPCIHLVIGKQQSFQSTGISSSRSLGSNKKETRKRLRKGERADKKWIGIRYGKQRKESGGDWEQRSRSMFWKGRRTTCW